MTENVREIWSDDDLDRALAALHSEVDTDERALARARAELTGVAEPAPRRYRARLAAAAAAAVVAALVAGLLVVQTGSAPPRASAAAEALNSAADRIGASDPPIGPGQYRYVSTHAWWLSMFMLEPRGFSYLAENLIEAWVPADQRQRWLERRTVTGARKWVRGTEAEARAAGVPIEEAPPPSEEWNAPPSGGWQRPNEQWLAGLPRDPQQLYDRLAADAPDNDRGDTELLVYAADALRSGLVPADVRAALYRALAKLPGLEITDRLANLDGRTGTAFGMSDGDIRHEIIIDPETGAFIGERETTVRDQDGLTAGTVLAYTSVTTAVVDAAGARPS
ncbi:MAG TPA: CU044_5270 family protein [Actinophytocola sp.]|uniref:CU044_5270 family protein n=1 Tax=Actinophytocola sp. TaxID=1872138 RepID=UPI002DDD9873|nr:CU044_5270 family protein [Actinophytocola sp.]HEV2783247.1 CU044_5270 family protein [Actinophytocola sp.]